MNSISIYPPGCKDIQTELANDELIRRLKVKPAMKIRPELVIIRHSQSENVANLLLLILVPMQDSKTVMLSAIQMPSFSALQVVFIYLLILKGNLLLV